MSSMRAFGLSALLGLLSLGAGGGPARADVVKTPHVTAELVAETTGAAPGSTIYVALRQRIIAGWHTYWRNPGDSGEATTLAWTLPAGWRASEIVWPTPQRIIVGPLTNYGYGGEVLLPTPVQVPASAKPGQRITLQARAQWLVCKDLCVPEQGVLSLSLPVVAGRPAADPKSGPAIARTIAVAPKPAGLGATFAQTGSTVRLSVTGAAVAGADVAHAWFFPYDGTVLDHAGPQQVARGRGGLTFQLPAGYAFKNRKAVSQLAGVVSLGAGRAYEVTARPGPALTGADGLVPFAPTTPEADPPSPSGGGLGKLGAVVAAAFLGGLILNLMPCVFPVLSIKAAALVRHGGSPKAARAEGLVFAVGVVATFVLLAGLLIAARAAGQAVGWGFQLQSPAVVATLALLMLLVALNLSGVFEVGGSVQNAGSGLADRGGLAGAFFTGVLAVVVAAPCTAPFMAGAIGWAVTQSAPVALAVFAALGLGLALPFTALSFAPALLRRLPRPGPWMEGLRRVLAFPMYATASWLTWVFVLQAGPNALPFLFAAAVVLAFGAWLWGAAQRGGAPLLPRLVSAAALAAAIPLVVLGARMTAPSPATAQPAADVAASGLPIEPWSPARVAASNAAIAQSAVDGATSGLPVEPWSPERVAALRAEGRPVFVDFTAAWCVTCQVNERTALAGRSVLDAFQRHRAVYLKADWTNRDDRIARELSGHGRSGVPLYLLYDAKGSPAPRILPQLLTEGGVVQALDEAGAAAAS